MIEVKLEQGSQEWLDFRRLHRMASETPVIMGLSPYQKPNSIRKAKLNGTNVFVNDAMRQGIEQEPFARQAYEQKYELIRPAVFQDDDYAASLDGINMDNDLIWECKTPKNGFESERATLALKGEVTPYDFAQVQHQLMVTKASVCHFCVWDAVKQEFILVEIYPDKKYWLSIHKAWDDFWDTLILKV